MRALLAVARNSFLEAMRQPVMAMALIAMSFLITLLPATSSHLYTFSTGTGLECVAQRMVADLGLATVQLAGLLVSVFVSTTLISLELERKTAATVLVKPLSRAAFILGKYLGVALALILLSAVGVAMTLLTIRAGSGMEHEDPIDGWILIGLFLAGMIGVGRATFLNYSRGRSWIGSFSGSYMAAMLALFSFFAVVDRDHNFIFAPGYEAHSSHEEHGGHESELGTYDWEVAGAGALTTCSVLVLAAVGVAASTRLGVVGNALTSGTIFILGLLNNFLQGLFTSWNLPWLAAPLRLFLPDFERFWLSDALVREQAIPFSYLLSTGLYGLALIAAWLFLACWLFERRDVA